MLPVWVALALLPILPSVAHGQQCHADFNGNGRTEIGEVIIAVNEVLDGCAGGSPTKKPTVTRTPTRTPTPVGDRCPLDFNDHNFGENFCGYSGQASSSCFGTFPVSGGWQSDGSQVLAVVLDSGGAIGITASRTNATTARVTSVAAGPNYDVEVPATGNLSLPSNTRLDASFNTSASCTDFSFEGTFQGILSPSAAAERKAVSLGVLSQMIGGNEGQLARPDLAAMLKRFRERHGAAQ